MPASLIQAIRASGVSSMRFCNEQRRMFQFCRCTSVDHFPTETCLGGFIVEPGDSLLAEQRVAVD
jgi:hypothetical protein